ncbi:MAG: UvrB/UvrC motif-containing protein [Oceanipulchritudo sp.]
MAKPEQCKNCTKPATIHLTQIINNKIHKVDLCEDCPFKKGVTDPEGFSLADFILQPPAALISDQSLQCEVCGFTPADFKKSGRFGCPHCYQTFREILEPMLANMHKDTVHRGKVPEKALARMSRKRRLDQLEADLQEAVKQENYEEAARLRDLIAQTRAALEVS